MSELHSLPHEPLSLVEARILGCLIEKETTTPDYYPLTLNALLNACNQKSNRHPVLELDEETISTGTESLRSKRLALRVTQLEARVAKFKHSLDTVYPIPDEHRAILAELLIRGPQTAGELRTRCERMGGYTSLDQTRDALDELCSGEFPLLVELPRQPGKKDPRFAHLLSGPPDLEAETTSSHSPSGPVKVEMSLALPPEAEARIAALEATIATQAEQIATLRADLDTFRSQFD